MNSGVLVAIVPFLAWATLKATTFWVPQDQQNRSVHLGSTMTTLIRIWIPYLVNTMSIHWWKEWNVVGRNMCSCSQPTWKSTFHAMATKVSWTTSWVPMHSLPWVQRKRWTFVTSMGCVHTYWRIFIIEGCGNPSHIQSIMEKDGEDNRKARKANRTIGLSQGWKMIRFKHNGSQISCWRTCWKGYDGPNASRWNLEIKPFIVW